MNATARLVPIQSAPNGAAEASRGAPGASSQPPEWIETPTAARIAGALSFAQVTADVALIYGGAGLGKTCTARHYAANGTNVWHATMTPATAGVVPAMEEVCAAVGIPIRNGAAALQRAIVQRVTGTGGLLVIDEAQHLAPAALDQLRGIHDAAGIGLALLGNREVYARLSGVDSAAALDQLRSRVGKRLHLAGATRGDVAAVLDAWDITAPACRDAFAEIGAKPGGLRGLTKTLRLASVRAGAARRPVSVADMRAAWGELGGA